MHPKKYIIPVQPLRDVESGNVGYSKTRVDGEENKVLGVLACPCAVTRALGNGLANGIAGSEDAIQLFISKGALGKVTDEPAGAWRSLVMSFASHSRLRQKLIKLFNLSSFLA